MHMHSHGQLFRPYCSSLAWHAVGSMNGEKLCLKDPLLSGQAQSTPLSASSTQHMWELLAGNCTAVLPGHAQGRVGLESWVGVCVPLALKMVF